MLGGGTFLSQNKILPGAYINFVSAGNASSNLGERGFVAIALPLTWSKDGEIFTVTGEDFKKKTVEIFGFTYDSDAAKPFRDLFRNAHTAYVYKLMNGGAKASNTISEALYKGSTGTKIATEIVAGTAQGTFDCNIYFDNKLVSSETVSAVTDLKSNPWVTWDISTLEATAKASLSGSSLDGSAITATEHTAFLTAAEAYTFNAMACDSTESTIQALYVQAAKDARDDNGIKWQLVLSGKAADYEGVVNVKNSENAVYWTTGAIAGCNVNASLTNRTYDGEYTLSASYTKSELESAITSGEFTFHKVGDEVRVLEDINSLTTTTAEKGEDFKSNQTIRVLDQIAMDIAKVFNNKYLGKIPNDASGRISLWNDIVKHHKQLENIRAIENFDPANVTVAEGDTKKSVVVTDTVSVVNAMSQLYMSVVVA